MEADEEMIPSELVDGAIEEVATWDAEALTIVLDAHNGGSRCLHELK